MCSGVGGARGKGFLSNVPVRQPKWSRLEAIAPCVFLVEAGRLSPSRGPTSVRSPPPWPPQAAATAHAAETSACKGFVASTCIGSRGNKRVSPRYGPRTVHSISKGRAACIASKASWSLGGSFFIAQRCPPPAPPGSGPPPSAPPPSHPPDSQTPYRPPHPPPHPPPPDPRPPSPPSPRLPCSRPRLMRAAGCTW